MANINLMDVLRGGGNCKLLPNIKHIMLRLKKHYDNGDIIYYADIESPSLDWTKFTKESVEDWLADNL